MLKQMNAAILVFGLLSSSMALGQTVGERVESAVSQLNGNDAGKAYEAAKDLGDLGPLAKSAVPALVKKLDTSNDLALKHEILVTLGRIGTEAASAVPTVARYLDDKSAVLQHEAIHSLKEMGDKAKVTLPSMRALINSSDPVIRISAAWGLVEISDSESDHKLAVPVLLEGLKKQRRRCPE